MSDDPYRQSAIQPTQGQQPQQKPQTLSIPIDQIKGLAKYYPMLKRIVPALGFKIPKELDAILTVIANGGDMSPEQISKLQQTIDNGVPERETGKPVLTYDLARIAWRMHVIDGMPLRAIAEQFTKEGNPVAHTTLADWINKYEDDLNLEAEERSARRKSLVIKAVIVAAACVGFLVLGKLLL